MAPPAADGALRHWIDRLKDPIASRRLEAVLVLGSLGTGAEGAVFDLCDALKDADPHVSKLSGDAVVQVTQDAGLVFRRTGNAVGEVGRLHGHRYWVQSVALSPDGRFALSASGQPAGVSPGEADNTIRLWDLETGREVRCLAGHDGWVTSVACS